MSYFQLDHTSKKNNYNYSNMKYVNNHHIEEIYTFPKSRLKHLSISATLNLQLKEGNTTQHAGFYFPKVYLH